MRRSIHATLVALTLAAGCADDAAPRCPGEPVATFVFGGSRVDPAGLALDPFPEVANCGDELDYPPTLPRPVQGTLSADAATGAAALCRSDGSVMFGQRSGARFVVETETTGAILGACSPSCAAAMRLVIAGDVLFDEAGAPRAFEGLLVEELRKVDGECGSCLLPVEGSVPPRLACAARYAISATR